MGELREPTEEEREQDIKFLTNILFEIRDYARSAGQEPDETLKATAEWILALLKVATFNGAVQPERTEYIPDTKAVRSKRDCVDLAERVTATFFDEEHEEWTMRTVTIEDVLNSVCDEYTILTFEQPERKKWSENRWLNKE